MRLETLADVLARRNQLDLARSHLGRAVNILSTVFGETSPAAGSAFAKEGFIEQSAHNFDAAADRYQRALAGLRPDGSFEVRSLRVYVMRRYAESLKALHRNQEASALLVEIKGFRGQ